MLPRLSQTSTSVVISELEHQQLRGHLHVLSSPMSCHIPEMEQKRLASLGSKLHRPVHVILPNHQWRFCSCAVPSGKKTGSDSTGSSYGWQQHFRTCPPSPHLPRLFSCCIRHGDVSLLQDFQNLHFFYRHPSIDVIAEGWERCVVEGAESCSAERVLTDLIL